MNQKHVVSTFTQNQTEFIIRYPVLEDASLLMEYINTISTEKTYISFQGEQQTLEQEHDYISSMLSHIKHRRGLELVIEANGKLVGNAEVTLNPRSQNHVGVLGISIAKGYRDQGIGQRYLTALLSESVKIMPSLKIVTLTVNANNDRATHLYTKQGFTEFGRLPQGTRHQDQLVDLIYMYKLLA